MTRIGYLLCLCLLATAPLVCEMHRLGLLKVHQGMNNADAEEKTKEAEVQAVAAEEAAAAQTADTAKAAGAAEAAVAMEEADNAKEAEAAQDASEVGADEKPEGEGLETSEDKADALLEEANDEEMVADEENAVDPEAKKPDKLTESEEKINKVLEMLRSPEHKDKWVPLMELLPELAEELKAHRNGIQRITGVIDKVLDKVEVKDLVVEDSLVYPLIRLRATTEEVAVAETEEERFRNDALARNHMVEHMQAVAEAEARGETGDRGAWKWPIRKRVWDYMEAHDIAAQPRPVHNRIPNFVGAELAAMQVEALPEFHGARWVKINPDTPQKPVRAATLRAGKMLLVPQPRLRTGFFSVLNPALIEPQKYSYASTQPGVVELGKKIDLDAKIKVDMVIIGSVAVNPANGARIGKGEGFAELEYGMLRMMGAIDDDTPVVTLIHDSQLVGDIPSEKMLVHDVPVDIICTPTRTIRVPRVLPKPTGIYWDKLSPQKLAGIRVLQILKAKLEKELGEELPTGPNEVLPPTAIRTGKVGGKSKGSGKGGGRSGGSSKGKP